MLHILPLFQPHSSEISHIPEAREVYPAKMNGNKRQPVDIIVPEETQEYGLNSKTLGFTLSKS